MKLSDIVARLDSIDGNYVITCKGKPNWTAGSPARLVWVQEFAETSQDASIPDYFLEVFIAKEVLSVWTKWNEGRVASLDEKCDALIYYAKNDAYLPPDPKRH